MRILYRGDFPEDVERMLLSHIARTQPAAKVIHHSRDVLLTEWGYVMVDGHQSWASIQAMTWPEFRALYDCLRTYNDAVNKKSKG